MEKELITGLLVALSVALIGGIGWLIKRVITGERRKEAASELTAVLDLLHKLKASGMTMEQAKRLAVEFGKGKMPVPVGQQDDVGIVEYSDEEPDQYGTTMAMKMRLGAQLDAVNAQLKQALVDLELLLDENEGQLLEKAQADWEKHARSEATLASSVMSGGTLEGVMFLAEMIDQSGKRIEAVKEQTRQRKIMR
jgi:uncharacterized protein YecT (DUF1311 family)